MDITKNMNEYYRITIMRLLNIDNTVGNFKVTRQLTLCSEKVIAAIGCR